ncbi:MAG: hypothetical protein JWO06_1285 [Bacteroidota bacterium]|nr:hypothetical protein [Bacteroidota bacterium]
MKITRFLIAILSTVLLITAFSSCNKCYTCVYAGQVSNLYCTKHNSQEQLNQLKLDCQQTGGVWSLYNQ